MEYYCRCTVPRYEPRHLDATVRTLANIRVGVAIQPIATLVNHWSL